MLVCVDVDYRKPGAVAAGVLFRTWVDQASTAEIVRFIEAVEPYQPGQFYRRELPCLRAVLGDVPEPLDAVIIDGYVWLADEDTPGLGGHLFAALNRTIPIIGVAKTRFAGAKAACPVLRGSSARPLFVTAAGIDVAEAARLVAGMHGEFRIPTLLKRVDQLCRNAERATLPPAMSGR
jgi:deoxyribonuclease V